MNQPLFPTSHFIIVNLCVPFLSLFFLEITILIAFFADVLSVIWTVFVLTFSCQQSTSVVMVAWLAHSFRIVSLRSVRTFCHLLNLLHFHSVFFPRTGSLLSLRWIDRDYHLFLILITFRMRILTFVVEHLYFAYFKVVDALELIQFAYFFHFHGVLKLWVFFSKIVYNITQVVLNLIFKLFIVVF